VISSESLSPREEERLIFLGMVGAERLECWGGGNLRVSELGEVHYFILGIYGESAIDRFTYKEMVDRLYEAPPEAQPVKNPLSDPATKNKLIRSLYGQQGFAKQHIDSYDEFVNFRIREIITSKLNRTVKSDSV